MSELESGNESGVSPESSVSSETVSPVQSQESAPQQDAAATQAPKEQPFNEHPRFKELIAERNQEREERVKYAQEMAVLKAQLEQIQKQQAPKTEKPSYDAVLKRLEGIDPEFAELQKSVYAKAEQAEALQQKFAELEQWRHTQETARNSQMAINTFDKLCSDNKISENDKEFYKQAVTNLAYARNSGVKDLPALFQEAYLKISKSFEARDRAQRESYVASKKSDIAPATQTGGVASSAKSGTGPMTLDDVKAQFAKSIRSNGLNNI